MSIGLHRLQFALIPSEYQCAAFCGIEFAAAYCVKSLAHGRVRVAMLAVVSGRVNNNVGLKLIYKARAGRAATTVVSGE